MNYLIKNATIVNENELRCCDVLIENGIISKIERVIPIYEFVSIALKTS